MNLIELSKYLNDEDLGEQYLLEKGILKSWVNCPHCSSDKIGRITRGRIKCYKCKKEWHKRKDSVLESLHISNSKFLGFIKLYADELGMRRISYEMDVDMKSVIELYALIRSRLFRSYADILQLNLSIDILLFQTKEGVIRVTQDEQTVFPLAKSYGKLYLIRNKSVDGSFSIGLEFDWLGKKNKSIQNNINRFLSFLKHKFFIYRGVSEKYYSQYFLELLIRYNNREKEFFGMVIKSLKIDVVVETPPC